MLNEACVGLPRGIFLVVVHVNSRKVWTLDKDRFCWWWLVFLFVLCFVSFCFVQHMSGNVYIVV